ncbi:MAG: LamG-like jellyroll fold domain-containing protein, partial [Verrucomicrobiales bacterium]
TAAEASLNGDVNYSMLAWIKPTRDSGGDQMIFGQPTGSALHNGIRDQRLHIGHWGNDLGSGASAVTFNAWQHVAFTYEGGIQTIYINGEVTESGAFGGLNNPDENILIGTTVLENDRDYEGALDDVRIYNGALSATQIAAVAGLIDSDGDGILDPIERGFFGDLAMDGNGDPDEDGQTTAQELAGGSNPAVFTQFEREDGAVIEILGVGVEALLGGDLTDPENDGLDEAGAANDPSWNWVNITGNIEPDFGDPEQSFNIFDNQVGGGGAKWCCDDPSVDNPYWVSVEFAQPVSLTHFTITNGNDSPDRDPTNWQIQGSNDGENFETIFEESTKSIWTAERNEVALVTLGSASLPYTHIRYLVLDTPGSLHQLNEIEYFGDFFDPNGPAPGLIAYWDFNGAGDPVDLVNGTVAALTGGADYGDGYEGGAIDFGATDEGQTLVVDPSILAPIVARDKLTISYWQNLHNVANSSAFWADAAVAGDRAFQAHTPWSNGSVYFDTAGCCDPPQRISAAVDTPVGTWQHFAFVKDGPNKAVYVDGVEAFAGGDAAPIPEGFLSFNIGSANDGASSIQGLIDEFSIWSVALSADEIADLAAGGKPSTGGGGSSLSAGLIGYWPLDGDLEDKVGDAHGFEVGSAPIEFGEGGFGQGVDLDGIDQYVSTPVETEDRFDFSDDTGFSVSAWFRVDSFDKSWQAIVTKGEGSNWRIHRQGGNDNLGPVAGQGDFVGNPVSVNDGALHHVVITNVPGESTNFYLDGVLNESRAAGVPEGNEWPMMIGENANGGGNGRTFNGLIDEVAVWNRALSDGEVGLLYSGPSLGEQISGGGGDDPRASAAAQSSGPITSPTLVDFGVLSGDASYEFSANIVKLGPSTAVAGNDAWALKWEQWNETGFFGSTEFGVVDNTSEAPTVFGADTHVVFVSDTAAGETLIYVNGALSGSVPGNPLLSGPGAVFGARDGTTDPAGDGSVLHGWATYDFALSADDVAALAATPFGGGGGMVVYSEDFSQEDGTTDLGDGSTLSSNTTGAGVFGGELQLTEFGGAGGGTAFV